ncbi:hypothetical protein FRC02_010920 [Tulasnella sp. 418]|nr:hypothetical protein FRC02_010920 [Tulasnella sp. 418]
MAPHQSNNIPRFEGTESSQEAKRWLEAFIAATGSCSESGIFRLLKTKLPPGSPARKWYDELNGTFKRNWDDFEQQFGSQWIAEARRRAEEAAAWDVFVHHRLTSDAIFSKKKPHLTVIAEWNKEHYRLGKATNRDDSSIIAETRRLLPSFIVAYLQVHIKIHNPSFIQYCNHIHDIPSSILDMEGIRVQLASRSKDNASTIEGRIQEVYEKVYQIVATNAAIQSHNELPSSIYSGTAANSHGLENEVSVDEMVVLEPRLPAAFVESMNAPSPGRSEHSTPLAQPSSLPNSSEEQAEDTTNNLLTEGGGAHHVSLLCVPITWRKPVTTLTRKAQIARAQSAIDFILTFKKPLQASHAHSLRSAMAICDKIVCSHHNEQRGIERFSVENDQYESLLLGLNGLYNFRTYENLSQIDSSVELWSNITRGQGLSNIVASHQEHVTDEKHGHEVHSYDYSSTLRFQNYTSTLKRTPSGESVYAGGLFSLGSTYKKPEISSLRTTLFMTFSSYLAECTCGEEYKKTAVLSANCIKQWMFDPTSKLIIDRLIESRSEYWHAPQQSTALPSCHLTGTAIEGFSVLGSVTGDDSWTSLAVEIAIAAMHHKDWHGPNGVLNVGSEGIALKNRDGRAFKGLLNRGLLVAYQRNRLNKGFCDLVRSYINVQCNALLEISRFQDSYGLHWGAPYTGPNALAQMAAIDTLVAAIGVN